jgi:hypothetical protein
MGYTPYHVIISGIRRHIRWNLHEAECTSIVTNHNTSPAAPKTKPATCQPSVALTNVIYHSQTPTAKPTRQPPLLNTNATRRSKDQARNLPTTSRTHQRNLPLTVTNHNTSPGNHRSQSPTSPAAPKTKPATCQPPVALTNAICHSQ